jgi:beta-lactamase class A
VRHRIAAGIVTCAVLAIPAAATATPYPTHRQMDAVRAYVKHRAGVVGVGVIDNQGRVRGIHDKRRFVTASVIKAMLLVSYLRKVDYEGRGLSRYERSYLGPMIRVSSNSAATWAYNRIGDVVLRRLARRADMDQFWICCSWSYAHFSARDQAKFFWQLERLTPPRFRDYALRLLRSIVLRQSWGIPRVGRPLGASVFFKGGWRGTGIGNLVHQASFIRYGGQEFSLAVLTDGNPSKSYGIATIQGVARRIMRVMPSGVAATVPHSVG